jgi:hypothetical protein
MLKKFAIPLIVLTAGCQPATSSYTTRTHYEEKYEGDKEKGLAATKSWKFTWERKLD